VVTGAGSGMGRAFAERFARAGMNVVLADIEAPKLDEAVAAIQASGASAIGVPTDVTDAAAVDRLRDAAMAGLFPGHSAYGASKWAVVGITEGLYQAMRTRGTGVGVSCLCPGWVNTEIDRSERNRPEWAAPGLHVEATAEEAAVRAFVSDQLRSGMEPDAVADLVHDAVVAGQFWIFTDQQMVQSLAARYDALLSGTNPSDFDLVD